MNILKKNLENHLYDLYSNIPKSNYNDVENVMEKVRYVVSENQSNKLTFGDFYLQQIGFIRKHVWIIQFIILLFCGLKLHYSAKSIQVVSLVSAIAPLIFLSGITELSRTYTYGTTEIELSTKYTLSQIMISRMSILGLMNIFSLTILCVIVKINTSLHVYDIFLYTCVPFIITCFGCLWLLNRLKNRECNYYCLAFGIFVMILISMSSTFLPKLYITSLLFVWNIAFMLSTIGVAIQTCKLIDNCNKKYDYINLINI